MRIEFEIPGEPTAKGRAKFARHGKYVRTYTPDKTAAAEQTLVARSLMFRPNSPLDGALYLDVVFYFAIPESWPRWKREAALAGQFQHVTKPDTDNLLKLLKDAFNEVFWLDDKMICDAHAVKRYTGDVPRTHVVIETLPHVTSNPARILRTT